MDNNTPERPDDSYDDREREHERPEDESPDVEEGDGRDEDADEGDEHDEYDGGSTFDADEFEGVEPVGLPRSAAERGEGDESDADRPNLSDAADREFDDEASDDDRDGEDSHDSADDGDVDSDEDGSDDDESSEEDGEGSAEDGAEGAREGDEQGEGDERHGRRRRRRGRGRDRDRDRDRGNRDREGSRRHEDRRIEVRQEDRRGFHQLMVVNDVPEDECRIAILENGRVEAIFMERYGAATNVGNIYKGRVTNVEPAIQAAFVDFGEGASGFLHVSDLHPKYFPGRERTERVGRKIPRRERPLIQEALRKGQEVLVQVLKEGISNKGPTLTSYLSIPGRLMVMMPDMDRVGVSRKVEDEDQRRAMRKILDQLDLPEGFGFILRTAGFDKTKTELSRDLAYLTRLWGVMKRRMESTGAPCLLYSEGDLLIRTIRDMADENVEAIVVDSEEAFRKAKAFLQVVAPRSAPKVRFWDRPTPLFHNFDVERQIAELHSRTVPLPSGGALVIDQAEALVAIDVNSGRSRSARDSETNAYQTNVEAVEEIARQLRLRDLGGVIINDLIDMRSPRHRREIEDRFRDALKRDRAKSTVLPISEFGVVEMTRQRMRPSVRRAHFMDCPHCQGLGEIRKPETVAADQLRQVEFLLASDRIHRVEMVCSVRVATVLLSAKRRALFDLERSTGKRVDVRISEAIPIDRVDLYAYDDRGADVELDRLPRASRPPLDELPEMIPDRAVAVDRDDEGDEGDSEGEERGGRRRRRRRRKPAPADTTAMILSGTFDDLPDGEPDDDEPTIAEAIEEERRHRRDEQRRQQSAQQSPPQQRQPGQPASGADLARDDEDGEQGEGGRRRRRRRRRGRGRDRDQFESDGQDGTSMESPVEAAPPAPPPPPPPPSEPAAVFALAKELGVTSKELLAKLAENGVEVKSHMSKLTGEQVDMVKAWYAPPPPPPPAAPPAAGSARRPRNEDGDGADNEADGDMDGEMGEGGRRRRRRRRRRGRGGDRDGDFDGNRQRGSAEGGETESDAGEASSAADGEGQEDEQADGAESSAGDRDGEAEGDRRGRRRRRRRGRGGDRDRDGQRPNAPQGGQASNGPAAQPRGDARRDGRREERHEGRPIEQRVEQRDEQRDGRRDERPDGRREGRRDDRGGERRDGRDRQRNRDRHQEGRSERGGASGSGQPAPRAAAPAPEPKPDPMPQPAATPAPRSLYGGRIRKLSGPVKSGGGGGDEE